jgi:hygromycin-B 7''-O-kinase
VYRGCACEYASAARTPGAWLPEDQRESVLTQVGEIIAEVRRVPVGNLSQLQPQWEQFIPKQIEGCRAGHEHLGLPKKYLDGLEHFLRDAAMLIPVNAAPVIPFSILPPLR